MNIHVVSLKPWQNRQTHGIQPSLALTVPLLMMWCALFGGVVYNYYSCAMRCVKGVGPNDVTLFISRRPLVRMRICLCRLFKVVKSSSGTGSVDTAYHDSYVMVCLVSAYCTIGCVLYAICHIMRMLIMCYHGEVM